MKIGERLGEGKTAVVFEWGRHEVIKVFNDRHMAIHEARNAEIINGLDIRTPKFTNMVEVEGKTGLVYERVTGQTMLHLIEPNDASIAYYASMMAELHASIHRVPVHHEPNLKLAMLNAIQRSAFIEDTQKAQVLKILDQLPDAQTLCHYDFHPDNIMITPNGPVILDWANALIGHTNADVARSAMILKSTAVPPQAPKWVHHRLYRDAFLQTYLHAYMKDHKPTNEEIDPWMIPSFIVRLEELTGDEQHEILDLLHTYLRQDYR